MSVAADDFSCLPRLFTVYYRFDTKNDKTRQIIEGKSGMDTNALTMMTYDANKKGVGVTYLLWIFFGGLGGHRFYAGRTPSAIGQLFLFVLGCAAMFTGGGFLLLAALYIWVIVDAFLIPGMIRSFNLKLAARLSAPPGTVLIGDDI